MNTIPATIKIEFLQKKSYQSLGRYAASLGSVTGINAVTLCEDGFLLCELSNTGDLQRHRRIMGAVACILSSCRHQIIEVEE